MSTKDLFNKNNKVLTKSQVEKIKKDIESEELAEAVVEAGNRFLSHVDYSKPENFSFYGSAQKYYEDTFDRIYKTYPYDGSQKEKQQWLSNSSELDLWVLDKAYPKSTGHVKLGTNQSITVKGGPRNQPGVVAGDKGELSRQFPAKQGNSNIWDTSTYRNSNLYIDGALGNTIEFWAKLDSSVSSTAIVRIVTITNTAGATLSIDFNRNAGSVGIVCEDDESIGLADTFADATFLGETWAHYSFSFINTATQVRAEFYKNGVLSKTITSDDPITTISQEGLSLVLNGTAASTNTVNGLYLDEFRFWKRARTAEEIGRNWLTNIHGGTNTDDDKYSTENRKVDLGVYYKFNEGITTDDSIDASVLDYSGRISNGTITNYTSTVRITTSAFDEYVGDNGETFRSKEKKDPIIYSDHPELVAARSKYKSIGVVYDLSNNSSIYHTLPNWITDEDINRDENVKELSQVISSYFDNAQIQIQEITNLQEKRYNSLETENDKPFFLVRRNLESQGFETPDLFTEASAFEEILSRNDTSAFEEKLQDVKNTIYQNIYNNLSYIYKSKGTEKAFRNLIRCFGIDDELVKINMYSDGADYLLEDTRRTTAIKKKFVDFNNADREQGLVYTKADPSNVDSNSYIRGVGYARNPNLSFTFQTEIIFPKRISSDHPNYDIPTNLEEHIAYLGEYTTSYSANDLFDLKAVKEGSDASSENVKFVLTMDGQTLETQFFKSVYENSKWNLAVRLVPKKSLSGVVSGGSTTDYRAELYCVRMLADVVEDEQTVAADITETNARALLAKDKYVSIGALVNAGNPEPATVSSVNDTRVKMSSTLFWYDNVTNEEVRAHASDASNFGRLHPSEEAYMFDLEFNTDTSSAIQVPRRDTLAMHWDFSEVSTTDGSGEFIVNDLSQGNTITETDVNKKSIQFSANGDTIDIADSDDLSFTDGAGTDRPFSISAWVKVGNIATDSGVIMSRRNSVGVGDADGEWIVGHTNGGLYVILYADPAQNVTGSFSTGNRIYFQDSGTKLSSNTWHFVTVTYDGTQNASGLKVYKDGVAISPNIATAKVDYAGMPNFDIVTTIGGTDSPTGNTFDDYIADTAVFNKALSSAEVTEIYNGGKVKDLSKASVYGDIISWWKMGDDLDTTGVNGIKDYVGSNNGTLQGTAAIVSETPLSDVEYSGTYGWFTNLVGRQVTGRGKHFTNNNDKQVVNREYVHSAKHRPPEVINSEDLVEIRSQDDITFTKDAQITTHFFTAEKSMYQVISDDMINLFATIVEFNDLIGQPVNRYRMEYKSLEKFRARYFEKVKNVPSLEKYIELYKWIDSSIGLMIQQIIPASANFSADLRNMVESHILERNKYWTKFPTLEMSGEPPTGVMRGINELAYSWKEGHAPVGSETTEGDKFLWGDKRVNASDIPTGNSDVDDNREILRKVATRTTEGMVQVVDRGVAPAKNFVEESRPILRTVAGATYEGRTFANRALSKPYRLNLDIAKNVHGGVNYSAKTKDPNAFIRAATRIVPTFNFGGGFTVGIAATLATNPVTYEEWKKLYTVKRTVNITISDTELNLTSTFDGDTIYPYYGYRDRDAGIDTAAVISGHHNDSYGDDAEIPMQGPFTETWVGGNQHRHIHFTEQTPADRPEFYLDDSGTLKHPQEVNSNNPAARYTRDEVAKRPVNIRNIKTEIGVIKTASYNFEGDTIGSTPSGWSFVSAPTVQQDNAATNKALSFLGTSVTLPAEEVGNFGSSSHWRVASIDRGFEGPLNISFKAYEGRSGGNYGITNPPESTDKLWLQYSTDGATWTTAGNALSSADVGSYDLTEIEREIPQEGTIYLRWVNSVSSGHSGDNWAIDDISISFDGSDRLLGNYTRDYEVVQTSGRTQNNSWFVASGSGTPTEIDHPFVVGDEDTEATPGDETTATIDFVGRRKRSADFALPDRGRSEHVIVERFSAPGESLTMTRGYLDRIAEEFSPYSGMNNRNSDVRSAYAKRLYTHSGFHEGSQGYESSSPVLPSAHKVNRNAFFRPLDTGCTTDYDNAYVSHQIPRSDLQYAFVTASIDYDKYRNYTEVATLEYPHKHCGSGTIPVLFSEYYDEIHVQKGNEGYNAPYADFQGGGWRFIRNVEKAAVINQRKKNTYSQLNRTDNSSRESQSTAYVEPAVSWNKPNVHYVLDEQHDALVREGRARLSRQAIKENSNPISYSYSNNLETFSNQDLADAIDLEMVSSSQFSDTLFDIFSKAELLFSYSIAREIIFPKHKNVGLKKTRTRTKFDTYKFFWKDKMFDRVKCSNITKLGYEMTPEFKKLFKQKFSVDVMDSFHFHQTDSTDNEYYKVIGDLTYMGEDRMRHMITRKDLDLTDTSHPLSGSSSEVSFLGLEGICEAQATSSDIVPVYSSSEITRNKTAPIPSPQLYHNPYNENYKESEGWINRKPITSGQKANYNDYDSFSEEVKLAAQNYGLVSEFRISEHMDKYILENGGNFRTKNYDFLTLDGASHDGESHTLSSGTSIKETSTFYSLKKEDDSLAISAYPTSSTDTALVKNNAEGFFGYNPIYTPAGSDFVIANSVNSEVEIFASDVENYISIEPYQDGVSAAGKFNLDDSNHDYLKVMLDNVTDAIEDQSTTKNCLTFAAISGQFPSSPDIPPTPSTISIWAQPESRQDGGTDTNYSNGVWSITDLGGNNRATLFTSYYYSGGDLSRQNFGLTFVATDAAGDGLPGGTVNDDSTVYTFFKKNGDIASLESQQMNSVILQLIPPEETDAANRNFLIKAWLNGEELYGVHIREFENTIYTDRDDDGESIKGYSPCPIGQWKGTGDKPWFTDYESGNFNNASNGLRGLYSGIFAEIGSVTSSHKFRGLLDEFTIFRGILPSSSITAIYNNGVPNNVNELVANGQIVGNGLYEGTGSQSFIINGVRYSYPVPATVDNGEFDLGNKYDKYHNNFESTTASNVPTGWTTNESVTPANGPVAIEHATNGNKIFALKGTYDTQAQVENPPLTGSSNRWRWVELDQTFDTSIDVSFKAWEGQGDVTEYGLDAPEANENLYLQYELSSASGTWTTLSTLSAQTGYDLTQVISASVPVPSGQSAKLRWIIQIGSTATAQDVWGIDDIEIKESGITSDQYTAEAQRQRIQILAGSAPLIEYTDFDNNYSVTEQQSIEASLPVWHRIGVPSYDKVVTQGQWDDEFFSSYVHTDDINFIEAADAKHDELGLETTKKVRLKVNAIKKLLPYEGFYPQDRTVQLANLFVEKVSPDILHNEKVYKDQAIQAALQHFFAPGILYNSIKAGIACDWASYTNESGIEPSYFGSKINILDSGVPSTKYSQRMAPIWYLYPATIDLTTETFLTSPPVNVDASASGPYGDFSDSLTYDAITTNSYTSSPLAFDVDYLVKDLIITKAPSKRLPFEAILDPYKYLRDGDDATLQDAAGTEKIKKKPNQHFLMNPSYYKNIIKYNAAYASGESTLTVDEANSNYKDYNYPYFEVAEDSHTRDNRYEMAMNNFLAESTKFFIKGEQLSSFASNKPQGSGFTMDSGKAYYMDVVLSKSKEFSIVNSPGSLGGRYFGPPVRWIGGDGESYQDESGKISDAAFAPYAPSYFYAESSARIKFTPPTSGSTTYTLDEIFELSEVTDVSDKTEQYFSQEAVSMNRILPMSGEPQAPSDLSYASSPAYTARMSLSASIELFGKTKLSRQEFDADGNPTAISSANNTELDTWVIYSKFECPLFDFSDSSNASDEGTLDSLGINKKPKETLSKTTDSATYDYTSSYLNTQNTERFTVDKRTGSGIWAGYGKQQDGNGVTISIRESFPQGVSATTGSLIDVCGFTPETKQVGRVADEKEITEAVVMIPFLDSPLVTDGQMVAGVTSTEVRGTRQTLLVDDRNFIKIDVAEYDKQKSRLDKREAAYELPNGTSVNNSSITSMIKGMRKYNIPPLYDFETFDQDPFVMYFFEFKHTLDREDLSNIWQGLPPKIAKESSLDSAEVDHEINPHEFFGNLGELPEGVRWMTFKVKRKAEKSYYKMTQDSRDDSRFKFDFEVGTKEPEYGYNYPYDYFTMLELIQVEAISEKEVDPVVQHSQLQSTEEET
jgi:hypothetical protein